MASQDKQYIQFRSQFKMVFKFNATAEYQNGQVSGDIISECMFRNWIFLNLVHTSSRIRPYIGKSFCSYRLWYSCRRILLQTYDYCNHVLDIFFLLVFCICSQNIQNQGLCLILLSLVLPHTVLWVNHCPFTCNSWVQQ